ncbi:hypothetical protein SAMN04488063_2048 [Halopelagius inordinatus]|uniref:DUF7999 domain-containing protein n=1 Tax=Halopelagius inordinatus TaxID=553467 RepID=A0A1I2RUU2_9EURY|nr:hypothetical protein [Halopelagius inordinatus]SFG43843.1 hypothetical protein SAMN04488063_2048 [Halopelagius inordinatus]
MVDSPGKRAEPFTIIQEMNDHGAMTVRARETHATYQVVEYGDESVRSRVADLPAGSQVRIAISRVGGRGNAWRANEVLPGTRTTLSAATVPDA